MSDDIIIRYISSEYPNEAFDVKLKRLVDTVYISESNSRELARIKRELLEALSLVESLEFSARYPELLKEKASWNSLNG